MRDILLEIEQCLDDINTALSPEEPEETPVQEEPEVTNVTETRSVSKKTRRKEA